MHVRHIYPVQWMHGRILYYISLLPSLQSDAEMSQISECERNIQGAKARVLYNAMRCHANG